jgi:hypothetical protein
MIRVLVFIIFYFFLKCSTKAQGSSCVYDSIKILKLDYYATQPIDSFLKVIPQSYSDITIIGSTRSNRAIGLSLYYPSGLSIWIRPKNSDTTLAYLRSLNLELDKNKSVDSFITKLPTGFIEMKVLATHNPKIANVLSILYPNKVFVWIYVYKFQFMNPRSNNFTWDMILFRKEKVHHIEVWKSIDCYNGCLPGVPTAQ